MGMTSILGLLFLCFFVVNIYAHQQDQQQQQSCSSPILGWGNTFYRSMITPDGRNRTYQYYLPAGGRGMIPLPVVFVFHGKDSSARRAQRSFGWDPVADANQFIVVYPDGYENTWNAGSCCGDAMTANVDDVLYVSLIIDRLADALCINQNKVFATGMSNGGAMTHRLACDLSSRIRAAAPVAGTLMKTPCTPGRAIPIYEIHGTNDLHVPFFGGQSCAGPVVWTSVPSTIDSWASTIGCSCSYTTNTTQHCATVSSQLDTTCSSFGTCRNNTRLHLCVVQNGGHTWPGMAQPNLPPQPGSCDGTVGQFPATQNIWTFFNNLENVDETTSATATIATTATTTAAAITTGTATMSSSSSSSTASSTSSSSSSSSSIVTSSTATTTNSTTSTFTNKSSSLAKSRASSIICFIATAILFFIL
eukprot:TRINITY_DN5996_c0_g1_i2.p1 TRINITY_DN5996_c0_g1~~TRINITY_DN5996_c0_g1_i2.p1  ORF type:complete len:419 (+),score=87.77 TRINITY_DN5996_c0_g1_i2:151-1407(+)